MPLNNLCVSILCISGKVTWTWLPTVKLYRQIKYRSESTAGANVLPVKSTITVKQLHLQALALWLSQKHKALLLLKCFERSNRASNENWLLCLSSAALHTECRYVRLCLHITEATIILFSFLTFSLCSPRSFSCPSSPCLVWSAVFFPPPFPQLVLSSHFILQNTGMVITLYSYCSLIQFYCD